jgi:hypothetical protein
MQSICINSKEVAGMNREGDRVKSGIAAIIILAVSISIAQAQEQQVEEQKETNQLLVPDDLTVQEREQSQPGEGDGGLRYEEVRIGGRLERVTVKHEIGITEIYQNRRDDELWSAGERELGDVQNVRQWKLGGW